MNDPSLTQLGVRWYSYANPINTDTKGAIESVRIYRLSVLSGLNFREMKGLSFPRDKANCP